MPQGAAPYGAAQCWTHAARTLGSCTASLLSRSLDARRRMVQRSAGRMVQRGDGREPSGSSRHLKRMADPAYSAVLGAWARSWVLATRYCSWPKHPTG